MAQTINITIPNPVLTAGQYFLVKYKLHSSNTWITLANQTNITFSIVNLADGDYDISYSLVMADGFVCPERIDHFTIFTRGCECLTNAAGVVEEISANNFQIKLTFTPPLTNPKCGWIVRLTDSVGTSTQFLYPAMTSPFIIPVMMNSAFTVEILADCCGKDQVQCAILDLPRASGSSCVGSIFPTMENQNLIFMSGGKYFMQLTATAQSIPATPLFSVQYQQAQTNPFFPPDAGFVNVAPVVSGANFLVVFEIHPEPNNPMTYNIQVRDICGGWFNVFKQ